MAQVPTIVSALVAVNYMILFPDHRRVLRERLAILAQRLSDDLAFRERCSKWILALASVSFASPVLYYVIEAAREYGLLI